MSNVVPIRITPKIALDGLLKELDQIKGLVVLALNKDDTTDVTVTVMSLAELSFLRAHLDTYVLRHISDLMDRDNP